MDRLGPVLGIQSCAEESAITMALDHESRMEMRRPGDWIGSEALLREGENVLFEGVGGRMA